MPYRVSYQSQDCESPTFPDVSFTLQYGYALDGRTAVKFVNIIRPNYLQHYTDEHCLIWRKPDILHCV